MSPLLDALTLWYVVPHLPAELTDASPFLLQSPGIIDTLPMFARVAVLPRDTTELIQSREELARSRIAGRGHAVLPIQTSDLSEALERLRGALVVVLSATSEISAQVQSAVEATRGAVLHSTPDDPPLDRAVLRRFCLKSAELWAGWETHRHHARALTDAFGEWQDPLVPLAGSRRDRNHLVTAPNALALESLGRPMREWDGDRLVGNTNDVYFHAIRESVEELSLIRGEVLEDSPALAARSPVDLVLTVPGVLKAWLALSRNVRFSEDPLENKRVRHVLRQLVGRELYPFTLDIDKLGAPDEFFESPAVQGILHSHTMELRAYTAMLGIRAATHAAPVIRLPPSANNVRHELQSLRSAHRGGSTRKLSRLGWALSQKLVRDVPGWIIDRLRGAARVKLVADMPLEWCEVDGFPLMLRADVSRIPTTPGALFVQNMLQCRERAIPAGEFQEVLVVRSFRDGDPVKPLFESALQYYSSGDLPYPRCRIVDVRNRREFVDALDDFPGAILVYDGHGGHDTNEDLGYLALANERVDAWSLRGETRIPPIVILSACDTHPFAASHATTANGFLAAGAATVVGAGLPLDGIDGAVFAARLLHRVGHYLPLLVEHRPWKSFRWSEIVPGLQRRQYVTHVLQTLMKREDLSLDDEQITARQIELGMAIDTGQDWLAMLVEVVSEITSRTPERAQELLRREAFYTEALAYVQLGNPEMIVGYGD